MGFFKAILFITLWVLLSFFWVSMGQAEVRSCSNYGAVASWLKPCPVLKSWYQFYLERNACESDAEAFFKTLAASEALSIKLNQERVTFEQFYVPLYHLLSIGSWDRVLDQGEAQTVQSDLVLIDHSLKKSRGKMDAADWDYFRAVVLLDLPSEFVEEEQEVLVQTTLSKRLNPKEENFPRLQIDSRDVASPPYERVFAH